MIKISFTTEQFFQIFEVYNQSVAPIPVIFMLTGILVVVSLTRRMKWRHSFIGYYLGILWLWIGIVYQIGFFSKIDLLAYGFGVLFILQGLFFLKDTYQGRLRFGYSKQKRHLVGMGFLLFGLAIYPILSYFLKFDIDKVITLGLPCPSVIFTFGTLLLIENFLPKYLLIIPVLWSIIGTSAAFYFGVFPDYLLGLAALVTVFLWFVEKLVKINFT